MANYYNEIEPSAAAWLRDLVKAGCIAAGDVDERSIMDVRASDLKGYRQCHFFAGIGGWSYALRLAGWPDDRPVWTGSAPCQPFSSAGKRKGTADSRHLWPEFYRLIGECRPAVIFGEQVEAAIRLGWLDGVFADLEGIDYACGAAVLPAAGVGAPHIRSRIWWVAESQSARYNGAQSKERRSHIGSEAGRLADAECSQGRPQSGGRHDDGNRADATWEAAGGLAVRGENGGMGDAQSAGAMPAEHQGQLCGAQQAGTVGRLVHSDLAGSEGNRSEVPRWDGEQQSAESGAWSDFDLLYCRDGKARRVEPGTFPLADGVPARVGRLRGYGNAIIPQVAAEFIKAYLEC